MYWACFCFFVALFVLRRNIQSKRKTTRWRYNEPFFVAGHLETASTDGERKRHRCTPDVDCRSPVPAIRVSKLMRQTSLQQHERVYFVLIDCGTASIAWSCPDAISFGTRHGTANHRIYIYFLQYLLTGLSLPPAAVPARWSRSLSDEVHLGEARGAAVSGSWGPVGRQPGVCCTGKRSGNLTLRFKREKENAQQVCCCRCQGANSNGPLFC